MKFHTLISAEQLNTILDNPNTVVVDCSYYLDDKPKGITKFIEEHIPGAVYADLEKDLSSQLLAIRGGRHPLPDVISLCKTFSEWGIDDTVQVVAYDDRGGLIAARLWFLLKFTGHEAVAVLDGGFSAWKAAGHPISNKVVQTEERDYIAHPDLNLTVDSTEILMAENLNLVDSRSPERYTGKGKDPYDPVSGHIPGARNSYFQDVFTPDQHFKSSEDLKDLFTQRSVTDPQTTVFYCGSGVTAAVNLLAMEHAGLGRARIYPGSWSDWISEPEHPIATGDQP
jgi:thiosulfate/3-mercaptopyruvate sulfurtransferase